MAPKMRGKYKVEKLPGVPGLTEQTNTVTGNIRYGLVVYARNGRQEVTVPASSRTEAKKTALKMRSDIIGGGKSVEPTKLTVDAAFALYEEWWQGQIAAGHRRQRSWELVAQRFRDYVSPVIGTMKVSDVAKRDVVRVLSAAQRKGKSPSLVDGVRDVMGGLLQHCVDHDLLAVNVARALPKNQRPVQRDLRETYAPSAEEVEQVISAASDGSRIFFRTLAETGLRSSEALGLRWRDLDFEGNLLSITAQLDRDGRRAPLKTQESKREIPMTLVLRKALLEHRIASRHKGPDDFVFSTESGKPMAYANLLRCLKAAIKRAKVSTDGARFGCHSFRHAWATRMIAAGVDAQIVSRLLGHGDTTMLYSRYSHAFQQLRQGDLNALVSSALHGKAVTA